MCVCVWGETSEEAGTFWGMHCFCPTPTQGGGSSPGGKHPHSAIVSCVEDLYRTGRTKRGNRTTDCVITGIESTPQVS